MTDQLNLSEARETRIEQDLINMSVIEAPSIDDELVDIDPYLWDIMNSAYKQLKQNNYIRKLTNDQTDEKVDKDTYTLWLQKLLKTEMMVSLEKIRSKNLWK